MWGRVMEGGDAARESEDGERMIAGAARKRCRHPAGVLPPQSKIGEPASRSGGSAGRGLQVPLQAVEFFVEGAVDVAVCFYGLTVW